MELKTIAAVTFIECKIRLT